MDVGLFNAVPGGIWGFLVGFVGWGSCFSLIRPIADLLVPPKKSTGVPEVLARLLVVLFLIFLIIMLLTLLPLVLVIAGGIESGSSAWRTIFGIAFIASLAGVVRLGLLRRLAK